jgi:hypothetical protein
MTAGRTYYFNTTGGSGDNYGQLYSDVSGSILVAENDDSGGNYQFSLSYTAADTKTYYLRVRAYTVGNAWSGNLNYYYTAPLTPGVVMLVNTGTQASNMTFTYSGAGYDTVNDPGHWRITNLNGYMQFTFTGQQAFGYHALGSTSGGVSYCYVDVYVNGVLKESNKFISSSWTNYYISAGNFTTGSNTVKIVSVGSTHFWLNQAGTVSSGGVVVLPNTGSQASNMTFTYSGAGYDTVNDPGHWRITNLNGYMQFGFSGQRDFAYHALGSTSGGVSYCYVDVYVNGVLKESNKFIPSGWAMYSIAASNFSSGSNTVKIVLVGSTHFWLNEAGVN